MSLYTLSKEDKLSAIDQMKAKAPALKPGNPITCVRCRATGPTVSFVTSPEHGCWFCFACDAERV